MTRTDELALELYKGLISNPNFKITSGMQGSARAARKFAKYLRDEGRGITEVKNTLLERCGYTEIGAKVVAYDTFFGSGEKKAQ
ncbi:MAG TPA: hypothetical protein VJJ76_01030 [archaeon]|nr:hypothetical protein [archaeon]